MKLLLALVLASAARAVGPQINGSQINPQTGISVSTLTATGATGIQSNGGGNITVSGGGVFSGPATNLSGTAASLTAGAANVLAATPSTCASGTVAGGVTTSGACVPAAVLPTVVAASTSPIQAAAIAATELTISSVAADGSTWGFIPSSTTANTSSNLCVPGSSITVTSNGKFGLLSFLGTLSGSSTSSGAYFNIMLDGVVQNGPQPGEWGQTSVSNGNTFWSIPFYPRLSVGVHHICLILLTGGTSAHMQSSTMWYYEPP